MFLYVTLGMPARGGHSSNKYCVTVYGSILMRFPVLFRMDCSFRCTTQFLFSLLGGATISVKLLSKIVKSKKKQV